MYHNGCDITSDPIKLRYSLSLINSVGLKVAIFPISKGVRFTIIFIISFANGKSRRIRIIVILKGNFRCSRSSSRCPDKGLLISPVSDNTGVRSGA